MKIAILSDVHDHRDNLGLFLKDVQKHNIEQIFHLWDYWAPWLSVKPLVDIGIPVTGIWWNNDGEKWKITKLFENTKDCKIFWTVYGSTETDWKKIFMVHYDNLHKTIAKSGDFDLVLYGHNHTRDLYKEWETLVCNPWAICWNKQSASYAIYDTKEHSIVHIELLN